MIKLFIREHIPLLCFTTFQLIAIFLVYWFDGYRHMTTALYAMFLGVCFLLAYLLYRYFTHKSFYERLANPMQSLDESVQKSDFAVLSIALHELLEVQYRHYQNQLQVQERKNEEHLTFMNQWIHQMKTPVSVIELLLQKFGKEHREARATVESIREENNRILNGLDLALHMARLEQFAKDYKVEVVNVLEVVREVINQNRKSFIQSSVYPKVMFEEETCTIASDRKWISIAINQIVMNAIKYTKISQVDKKEIQFQIEEKEQTVLLHICDTGIGIPKQDIKRVFEPFFTGTNGRKTREATGMGLYITKEICDNLHHGIYVQSTEGESTTFTFQFAKDEEYHALMRKMTKL